MGIAEPRRMLPKSAAVALVGAADGFAAETVPVAAPNAAYKGPSMKKGVGRIGC